MSTTTKAAAPRLRGLRIGQPIQLVRYVPGARGWIALHIAGTYRGRDTDRAYLVEHAAAVQRFPATAWTVCDD